MGEESAECKRNPRFRSDVGMGKNIIEIGRVSEVDSQPAEGRTAARKHVRPASPPPPGIASE